MSKMLYAAIIQPLDEGQWSPSVSLHRTLEGAVDTLLEEMEVDREKGQDCVILEQFPEYDGTAESLAAIARECLMYEGHAGMDRNVFMVVEAWPGPDMATHAE